MQHWPDIPYQLWKPTGESLHMWLQIVGKFRLALTPWVNHSWHATFYVTSRGLTTSLIPGPNASYIVDFDFFDHRLVIRSTSGDIEALALHPQSVADFHAHFVAALDAIGAPSDFHGSPNELPEAIPFAEQKALGSYEPEAAHKYWQALLAIDRVFQQFRTGFLGKVSPVHLFWGSMDLAVTRFSGREAPAHPGGIPNLPDSVTREAYSHEVSSAGFWAGGGGLDYPAFYSYAYPTPEGFKDTITGDGPAFFDEALGEYVLPYDAVRTAADPEGTLLDFLEQTYIAAAETGGWDRAALECEPGLAGQPREI
ncbi:DUF5996 family protein [Alterisphingorhabdus coralli]|uniref:DUF5996 family protein n=1 Tax=Alterisphingorhabdus coralli TaxID=3071408 RepID=A0AA97F732_9SPHN|nr:DUF5996 family protein [Parasphingorhabdus sp. SCSIO 66989]WOE75614.1 DUF5996 family protein [Parasphingorhabdus sp. SCSIO 66989]